jgi:hypothetical protein
VVAGLVLLVVSLQALVGDGLLFVWPFLFGAVMPPLLAYCAVLEAVQACRLAAAERAYHRRRREIHVEDCPREPQRTPGADRLAAEEEAAARFLLDQD